MKRGVFIFAFVAFILLISGAMFSSNEQEAQKIVMLGCGVPNSGGGGGGGGNSNPNCFFKDKNLPEDNVLTYIAPAEVLGIELTAAQMGITNFPAIPASFKIHVSGANPSFALREGGTPPATTRYPIVNTGRDCALYTFNDRISFSGTYTSTLDHRALDPTTGQDTCYYKVIAGDLVQGFNDCPEIPRTGIKTPTCDPMQCSYSFDKTYTYGYIVIADKPGCNPLVTPVQVYDSQDAIAKALVAAGQICQSVQNSGGSNCGNGQIDSGEECDGTNLNGKTCTNIPGVFAGGTLSCYPKGNAQECKFNKEGCNKCGNSVFDEGEECDEGAKNGPNWWCSSDCKAQLLSYCTRQSPSQFCEACWQFKDRFGWEKQRTGQEEDTKNSPNDCTSILGSTITKAPDGADCRMYGFGGRYPNKPYDEYNWAWGICYKGQCVQSSGILLATQGKHCNCYCDPYIIEWNQYCAKENKMCVKQSGRMSSLSGNDICNLQKTHCQNFENGIPSNLADPAAAADWCEAQGKVFYIELSALSSNVCHCLDASMCSA